MPSFSSSKQRQVVKFTTFARLNDLVQQIACREGIQVIVFTEKSWGTVADFPKTLPAKFTVVASTGFSVAIAAHPLINPEWTLPERCELEVAFTPEAIAPFLDELAAEFDNLEQQAVLQQAKQLLSPNDPILQNQLTLALIEMLAEVDGSAVSLAYPPNLQQEQLLNQVVTQIRQSLELPVILSTAVEQVRRCLQVDRFLIYQFHPTIQDLNCHGKDLNPLLRGGCVTYEARSSEAIASVIHCMEGGRCFNEHNLLDKYQKGLIHAIDDIQTAYADSPSFIQFMQQIQVQSKLIVPIVVQDELWGLLIAHQCQIQRVWRDSEKLFLGQIAEHLAIAIYQAQLYAQLQQQKQTLEQHVNARTTELREALIGTQAASRAKSEFLAAMSHELRTPLTCVIGMSATLLRLSAGQSAVKKPLSVEKQREYLQTIHDSGKHLLELINDILDLSEVESGKAVLNLSEFSLKKLAYECREAVQSKAEEHEVQFDLDLQLSAKGDRFCADRRRVQQILLNLLSNAIKFTAPGGRVIFRLWRAHEDEAVFQVEDTGIGIAPEQQSFLFQKFQQLDTAYNRSYEGMGLGLALTKQLVDLHGGTIEVESTLNVGSSFTVRLPAKLSLLAEELVQVGRKPSTQPQGRLVLIENHEETAWVICDLLTAAGYQVVWLIEGTAAIKQIEILQPLVVITSLQLPGIDGYEIVRQLRELPSTQQIKILLLANSPTDRPLLEAQPDDYLIKPILPEQLLQKIANLISQKRG